MIESFDMQVDFLVPGLFDSPNSHRISESAPALAKLISRASVAAEQANSVEDWLARRFGDSSDGNNFPFASVAAFGEGIPEPGATYWLCADPVHLSVNRDRMVLLDASQLAITLAQSTALVAAIGAHFKDDGLRFFAPHPQRWYIQSDRPIEIRTHPVSAVRGNSVADYWFDGADRALWQTRLSEMQMLLHAHPINDARESANELPINGVWFWGSGKSPSGLKKPYSHIIANDALLAGFASLGGAHYADGKQFDPSMMVSGNALVVCNDLAICAAYSDWEGWQQALAVIDQTFFSPALTHLKNGEIKILRTFVPNAKSGKKLTTTRTDLFKFWRSNKL